VVKLTYPQKFGAPSGTKSYFSAIKVIPASEIAIILILRA
jgi:hypothetical protein